ncbi:unnamed protein product [Rhizoctonia solani]|uniref:Uncharacterized protein n=1 Tax=Rhizoctonia solani TaxID=456999 RepID=A0A8H3C402_9AGAM|nr:unnamed protein product [Rhizoctonia solani]
MTRSHTSRTSICVGSPYSITPEFVHDSDSEGGTPLVTPIHINFGDISNITDVPTDLDILTGGGYNRLDKRSLEEDGHDCPPAPRVDNGSFNFDLAREYESCSELNASVDFGANNSASDYSDAFDKVPTHQHRLLGSEDSKNLRMQVKRVDTILSCENFGALEDLYRIWTVPYAPRPDTGSWLSDSENVAPIIHGTLLPDKKPTVHHYSQLGSVAQSASVKSILPKYPASINKANPTEQPALDGSPTRIVRWNLGLGLTLDDIAEPDGCGGGIGETSVELAEDSFFELEMDSRCCSTTDTTLNTTAETTLDLASPCPKSPVGSPTHISGLELGITPRLRMLSLRGHHEDVKRQRTQFFNIPRPGTRLACAMESPLEIEPACSIERHDIFRGLSNRVGLAGAALEFLVGEDSLNEAQGGGHQMADTPIFTLLPPIEL